MPRRLYSVDITDALSTEISENNFVWLRSWGCDVIKRRDFTIVKNKEYENYNAMLDIKANAQIDKLLYALDIEFDHRKAWPTIYVDDKPALQSVMTTLRLSGFRPCFRNDTYLMEVPVSVRYAPKGIELLRIHEGQLQEWCEVYSLAFGRSDQARNLDLERWSRCFWGEPSVVFFAIRVAGVTIGTIQLCIGNAAGIYSMGILPECRGKGYALAVADLVLGEARDRRIKYVYLDRLRTIHTSRRSIFPIMKGFSRRAWFVVRSLVGYRRET